MITITQSAAQKIQALLAEEPESDANVLRVAIQGGGCSGGGPWDTPDSNGMARAWLRLARAAKTNDITIIDAGIANAISA